MGRDRPVWQGCRRIAPGHLFLMNPDVGDSLDGRYSWASERILISLIGLVMSRHGTPTKWSSHPSRRARTSMPS
ncbi:S26 family signal peptidase [Ancylobacter vacuolatus]|uniref:S26 family signal peptidase n=1 Tax=Ancylobacter vacuolatus TaxID=223389 RepID=UPI0027D79AEE|nr:S26 family signal peptidase [Ancylobacter vacuolatus]